jgi:hypothetical protein
MAAATHEPKVPAAKTGRGEESRASLRPSSEKELLMPITGIAGCCALSVRGHAQLVLNNGKSCGNCSKLIVRC